MNEIVGLLGGILCVLIGAVGAFVWKKMRDERSRKTAELEAERILNRARSEAQKLDRDTKQKAKDFEARARKNAESEIQKQKQKLQKDERSLLEKGERMDREFNTKQQELEKRLQEIASREQKISISETRMVELEEKVQQEVDNLKARL